MAGAWKRPPGTARVSRATHAHPASFKSTYPTKVPFKPARGARFQAWTWRQVSHGSGSRHRETRTGLPDGDGPSFDAIVRQSTHWGNTKSWRMLAVARPLIDKGESRTAEESALAEMLIALIARFEEVHYKIERSKPAEMLQFLIEEHGLRQRDLLDIFPTRSRVSEVLSGKRAITKEQAVALGKRFGVEAATFVELPL